MSSLSNAAAPNKAGPYLIEHCRRLNCDPDAALAEIERRERNEAIRLRLAMDGRPTVGQRLAESTRINLCELADEIDAVLSPRQTQRTIEMMQAFIDESEPMA